MTRITPIHSRSTMRSTALLILVVAGCSKPAPADQEKLVPVTGTVKHQGKLLGGAMVTFTPTGETKGVPAHGQTKEDGTYELINVRQNKGVVAGDYLVTVSRRLMPDGTEVPPDEKTPP